MSSTNATPPINKNEEDPVPPESVEVVGTTDGLIAPGAGVEESAGLFGVPVRPGVANGAGVSVTRGGMVAAGCVALDVALAVGTSVLVGLGVAVGRLVAGATVAPTADGGGTGVSVGSFAGLGVLVAFPPCGVRVG